MSLDLQRRLGVVLRAYRKDLQISQKALAYQIGLHRAYVGAVERGRKNLTLSTLQRISDGIGIQLQTLFARAAEIGRRP